MPADSHAGAVSFLQLGGEVLDPNAFLPVPRVVPVVVGTPDEDGGRCASNRHIHAIDFSSVWPNVSYDFREPRETARMMSSNVPRRSH